MDDATQTPAAPVEAPVAQPAAAPAPEEASPAEPVNIIYITSLGHSGSTLLDMLISSHSQAMTVGEIHQLNRTSTGPCACGATHYTTCPFWQKIDAALHEKHGLRLPELQMHSEDPEIFLHHNRVLFQTLRAVTGVRYFVDSSKKVPRLKHLMASPDVFRVIPIHLTRRPQGVVYSNVKKGRNWLHEARVYCTGMRSRRRALQNVDHLAVQYEALCRHPETELRRIMDGVGLPFEPAQLEWIHHEHHNLNGNKGTRSSTDATIRLDEKWRRKLWLHQKLIIAAIVRADERRVSRQLKGS